MIEPFVGPIPLGGEHGLYGRDAEVTEIFGLLMSRRIVLLHAPSGAGKTSLLGAGTEIDTKGKDRPPLGLIARLRSKRIQCLGPIRVGNPPPTGLAARREQPGSDEEMYVANRYTISAITSLDRARGVPTLQPGEVGQLRFRDYLARLAEQSTAPHGEHVLIFDQFEEVLTADPADLDQRVAFFRQLGAVLADLRWRAVIAMRSDYVGALDPYLGYVPEGLRCRFFLDLFTESAARSALTGPARLHDIEITEQAATKVMTDLRGIVVQLPNTAEPTRVLGRYIEPVHLQLVAQRLWRRRASHAKTIDVAEVAGVGDVDAVLGDYYDDCLRVAAKLTSSEAAVRRWIEDNLINQQGIRGQLAKEPLATRGMRNTVIDKLVESFLLRVEDRRGVAWIELSHDRLVEPIRTRNRRDAETRASKRLRRIVMVVAVLLAVGAWRLDAKFQAHRDELQENERRNEQRNEQRNERRNENLKRDPTLDQASTNLLAGRRLSALTWLAAAGKAGLDTPATRTMVREARRNLWSATYTHAPVNPVVSIVFRASDGVLASADSLGHVQPPDQARPKATTEPAPSKLVSVALDPLGRVLSVDHAGTIDFDGVPFVGALPGVPRTAVLDRNGVNVAIANTDSFRIWNPASNERGLVHRPTLMSSGPTEASNPEQITGLTFSPNGSRLAVLVGQRVELWCVHGTEATEPLTLNPKAGDITSVAFSASGYRIVVTTTSGAILLYNVFGQQLAQGGIDDLALAVFSPDEQTFATMTRAGRAQIWRIDVGPDDKFVLRMRTRLALQDRGITTGAAAERAHAGVSKAEPTGLANPPANPQGRGAVSAGLSESSFAPRRLLAWTPDGAALVAAGPGRTAGLWDTLDGNLLASFEEAADITAVAVAADGASVVLGTQDGTVRTWNASYQDVRATISLAGSVTAAAWGESVRHTVTEPAARMPPENVLVTATSTCNVALWSITGQRMGGIQRRGVALNVAIADPRHVIIACDKLWRWDTVTQQVETLDEKPLAVFFSTEQHHFATAMMDGTVELWDWSGSPARRDATLPREGNGVVSVAFSPDHKRVVTSHRDGIVRLWDALSGKWIKSLQLSFPLTNATFGILPDSHEVRVIVAGGDLPILWNPDADADADAPPVARREPQPLDWVGMTPEGKHILAIRARDTAFVWRTTELLHEDPISTARPITSPLKHDAAITYYDISADGSRLVTGTQDGVVQLWDVVTGTPISAAKVFQNEPIVAFSPDGNLLFEAGGDGLGRISDVRMATDAPADWADLVQRCSPFLVTEDDKPVLLPRPPNEVPRDAKPCQLQTDLASEQPVRATNRVASALASLPTRADTARALQFTPSTTAELLRTVPKDVANDAESVRDLLAVLKRTTVDIDPVREDRLVAFTAKAHRPDLTLEVYRRLQGTEKRRLRIAETELLTHDYQHAADAAARLLAPGKASNAGYQGIATAVRWIALQLLADAGPAGAAAPTKTKTDVADAECVLRQDYEAWAGERTDALHWNWTGLRYLIDSSPHSPLLTRNIRRVLDVLAAEPKRHALDWLRSCPSTHRDGE